MQDQRRERNRNTRETREHCYEDQALEDVSRNMGDIQVRRLAVLNRDKRLVGIVSLGDLSIGQQNATTGDALRGISRKGAIDAGTPSHSFHH